MTRFTVGDLVRVRGLLKNQEHNAKVGVVLRFVESKERYLVRMEVSGKKLQVRESNLSSVRAEAHIGAICCAKMANQAARQYIVMANQAVVRAMRVRAFNIANLAANYVVRFVVVVVVFFLFTLISTLTECYGIFA
jgi:hypothetical protein